MNGNAHAQRLWSAALAGQAMAALRIEVSGFFSSWLTSAAKASMAAMRL